MLFRVLIIPSLVLVSLSLAVLPANANTADLEKRLQQQERRIDRLEQAVESLQSRLLDAQYGETTDSGNSRVPDRRASDPLVGSWECTNNVFNYEISFFADGRLIQEEPFFSKSRGSSWSRLSEERFTTGEGLTFGMSFRSNDELTVTNLSGEGSWQCSRLK